MGKKRKAYLTVDVETAVVSGGKKNGEANQQWMWSKCKGAKGATHLVNVATGGCLTLEATVSDECDTVWEHGDDGVVDGTGTLFGSSKTDETSGFVRLVCGLFQRLTSKWEPPSFRIGSSGALRMCRRRQLPDDPKEPMRT